MKSRKKLAGYLFVLIGILMPLLPLTRISYNQWNMQNRYEAYREQAEAVGVSPEQEEQVERYNRETQPAVERNPVDPFMNESFVTEYDVDVSATDDVFAFLSVPSIDVMLPVYLGATDEHLAKGAAHVDGTALPVGGTNRRSVISGHLGWAGDVMFLNLGEVEVNDPVILERNGEILLYRVRDIQVIDKDDFESLRPEEGKDLVTLLTCWQWPPFPERLLVNCERVYENDRIVGSFDNPASMKTAKSEEPVIPEADEISKPARVRTVQYGAYALTALGWVYFARTGVRFVRFLRGV